MLYVNYYRRDGVARIQFSKCSSALYKCFIIITIIVAERDASWSCSPIRDLGLISFKNVSTYTLEAGRRYRATAHLAPGYAILIIVVLQICLPYMTSDDSLVC